jgi:hypothetical protein
MISGSLFFGLFTRGLISQARIEPAGKGLKLLCQLHWLTKPREGGTAILVA